MHGEQLNIKEPRGDNARVYTSIRSVMALALDRLETEEKR